MDTMDNICFICMDEMSESNKSTLNCKHQYHTECLKLALLNTNSNQYDYNNNKSKECPYCRTKINIIPLKENETPIFGLHYLNQHCCLKINLSGKNKNKICNKKLFGLTGMCLYHNTNKQCQAIFKSGKNKGQRCTTLTKNINGDIVLCGRHKNWKA